MEYQDCLDFLYSQLPIFQRVGGAAYKADLKNTEVLCEWANHPEHKFKSVHIAGTNGKGSVAHLTTSVLQEAGYKVGLYTSPHLKDFRERIRINGEMVAEEWVRNFVERFVSDRDELGIEPSFFELTVVMAFEVFAEENVDMAVVETGMGGRLDSTNVVNPELSIITGIGWDHMAFLGDSLPKIAAEKAGIIKANKPVVLGSMDEEARQVIENKARALGSPVYTISTDQNVPKSALLGHYQQHNEALTYKALLVLKELGWKIEVSDIKRGYEKVVENTGILGRWQQLNERPKVIADVGHNEDGLRAVFEQVKQENFEHLHIVLGVSSDKDLSSVISLFPTEADYYFCKANVPRGLPAADLAEYFRVSGRSGDSFPSVTEAYSAALKSAKPNDFVLVGGSFFVVAEVV